MPSPIFHRFLDKDRMLEPEVLKSMGLTSKIGIEGFSCEELEAIYQKFDLENSPVHVHHAQWGKEEQIDVFERFDALCEFICDFFFEDKIIHLQKIHTYVWEHDEQDFFVLFGEVNIIRQMDFPFLSQKYYRDVLDDDKGLSEKGRHFMLDALEKYGKS